MYDVFEDILEEAPSNFKVEDTTPAIKSLFQVEDLPLLSKELADQFYRTVVRFLYATKRVRLDMQVTMAFQYKRVTKPNTGNWIKL